MLVAWSVPLAAFAPSSIDPPKANAVVLEKMPAINIATRDAVRVPDISLCFIVSPFAIKFMLLL
jgi:hypothetical protein